MSLRKRDCVHQDYFDHEQPHPFAPIRTPFTSSPLFQCPPCSKKENSISPLLPQPGLPTLYSTTISNHWFRGFPDRHSWRTILLPSGFFNSMFRGASQPEALSFSCTWSATSYTIFGESIDSLIFPRMFSQDTSISSATSLLPLQVFRRPSEWSRNQLFIIFFRWEIS